MNRRMRLAAATLAALIVVASTTTSFAAGGQGWIPWAGMKKCKTFKAQHYRIYIYASKKNHDQKRLGCGESTRIMRYLWKGPKKGHHYHRQSNTITLDKFPGWVCAEGAGGGTCQHQHKISGYQAR